MRTLGRVFLILTCIILSSAPALAVLPDEVLDDPVLEARARTISKELRCVVCQNQVIDDSNAPLARDMRLLVRERLVEGDSDEEVKAYLVERYGNFVLMRPPLQANTLLLWSSPLLFLLAAFLGFYFYLKKSDNEEKDPSPLSTEEEEKIRQVMEDDR